MIISELARLSDHLLCTGAAALDLGAFTAFLYAFNLRELIYDVYEEMSGYRFHPGYTRVGGLLYDFNDRVLNRIQFVLNSFPKVYADMEKLLFRNRIFLDRVRGVGVLSKADAIAYSCSGPIARASGVTYDLRKDEPYLVYPELDFEVPYSRGGRLLGAVHRPDGGDAAEPPPHPAGGPGASRPGRSTCRSPRNSRCRTS